MSAGDGEGFLSRWSRRKREIDEPAKPEPAPAAEAAPPETAPEDEPVEPPSLDLIDKDFDVASWLGRNVPEAWKLAALRRAWLADPAIRDFENPARDYALDWNTPGGAPGYGPLSESDDVQAMVRQIFGEADPAESTPPTDGDSVPHPAVAVMDEEKNSAAAQHAGMEDAAEGGPERPSALPIHGENAAVSPISDDAAPQPILAESERPVRIRKRGGGALPL